MKQQKHSHALYIGILAYLLLERPLGYGLVLLLDTAGFNLDSPSAPTVLYWIYNGFRAALAFGFGMVVARFELLRPWMAGAIFSISLILWQAYQDFGNEELSTGFADWMVGAGIVLLVHFSAFTAGIATSRILLRPTNPTGPSHPSSVDQE
jgi:hypothetical protein